jgi:dipeptidyl aminopeptidase/acylaminoacyl peptidase
MQLSCLAVLALLVLGCAPQATLAPRAARLSDTLAAFGRLPSLENVVISPDGTRLVLVRTGADGQRIIGVFSLADRKAVAGIRVGDAKLRDVEWVDDRRVLLRTSRTSIPDGLQGDPVEWSMLQVYDVDERTLRPVLTGDVAATMNTVFGPTMVRQIDSHPVLFVGGYYATDRLVPGLFRIDMSSRLETMVRKGTSLSRAWLVDAAGEIVAERQYDDRSQRWLVRARTGGSLRDVASGVDPYDDTVLLGFSPTGDALIAAVVEDGVTTAKPLALSDGTWGPPLAGADSLVLDRLTDRMMGAVRFEDGPRYRFIDPARQAGWDRVLATYPGERVQLVSKSDDFTKLVVLVFGERHGYGYQLVDLATGKAEAIGSAYDDLPPLGEIRRISYPAADGLEIPAWLTLPHGRAARNLPLVVLPHGGPAVRDDGDFDWWAQALAASGYAVLQPNFRGSTIRPAHLAAGFGQWGRKMQTDLSDGVRYLAAQGIVDPARVCVVGASYGGYAALAGVTLESGVYRCAASVAGIADLEAFLRSAPGGTWGTGPSQRYWGNFMGAKGADDPMLDAISPIRHVAAASVPVLLVHGRQDTVVPYEQSASMAAALEAAGKPVTFVALDGEDHWLSRSTTRLQMLEHVVGFLSRHNPPG